MNRSPPLTRPPSDVQVDDGRGPRGHEDVAGFLDPIDGLALTWKYSLLPITFTGREIGMVAFDPGSEHSGDGGKAEAGASGYGCPDHAKQDPFEN